MNRRNQNVTNEEVTFSSEQELVSTTDLRGVITYANPAFCKVAGYSAEELVGNNHNLVRHPDMPKAAFADLWHKLKQGQSWRGLVKNRCKDGRYYWVDAFVTPIYEQQKLVGYQSVRVKPDSKLVERANQSYPAIAAGKVPSDWRSRFNLKRTLAFVTTLILALTGASMFGGHFLLALLLPLVWLLVCYDEFFVIPNRLQHAKAEFDSVSRWIYSGFGPYGIADFQQQMLKARLRTVLGRTSDSTHALNEIAETQHEAVKMTEQGIHQQHDRLSSIAAATSQLYSTVQDIAERTQDTHQQVNDTHKICEAAKTTMQHTAKTVQQLATEVQGELAPYGVAIQTEINSLQQGGQAADPDGARRTARQARITEAQTQDFDGSSTDLYYVDRRQHYEQWSQELRIHQSFDEYLRAWVLVHALHRALGFPGERPGVVGARLQGLAAQLEAQLHLGELARDLA